MNRRKHSIIICLLSLTFLLVASQPIFAAERIVKMVVPGCEWPDTANRVRVTLEGIPGVLQYDANQFTHEVTVKFDDTQTNIDKIIEGLAKQDFPIEGKPKIIQ
jgi:copper chaperone CopZ